MSGTGPGLVDERSAAGAAVDDGLGFGGVEAEGGVDCLDGAVEVIEAGDDGDADLGGGDQVDVDARVGQGGKEARGTPGLVRMPTPTRLSLPMLGL